MLALPDSLRPLRLSGE